MRVNGSKLAKTIEDGKNTVDENDYKTLSMKMIINLKDDEAFLTWEKFIFFVTYNGEGDNSSIDSGSKMSWTENLLKTMKGLIDWSFGKTNPIAENETNAFLKRERERSNDSLRSLEWLTITWKITRRRNAVLCKCNKKIHL